MKTKFNNIIHKSLVLAVFALFSCEDNGGKIESLSQENSDLNEKYQSQLIETKSETEKADNLQTEIHSLQNEIQKMKGDMPVYKASSVDEKAIEKLVSDIHKGWADMLKNDNTNELLQHFLPKYTTSALRLNNDNVPSVQRSNNSNFKEHLNDIMMTNNMSLSFGQTKFLYTEVKGDFFVTSYRTKLRVYENNKEVHSSSLVTLLAGEKKDGWKVGSYNWVTFNY